ncbi:MAG: GDP-mannose 4,6-dehydratase, partial [Candidatus Aminicenantes bacterium]|nr:GDP-mannose 4,6-dehydratase [Candidatus Aminicenantes bacterium]
MSSERTLDGKTILVTGGAGFIGSHFVRMVLRRHPTARIVNLDKLTYAGNLDNLSDVQDDPRYEFILGDIRDKALVRRVFARVHGVVHFAAETHVDRSIYDAGEFVLSNVHGTYTLLDALRAFPAVEFFIHVSTDEVYGSRTGRAARETDALQPSTPYAATKAAG